MQCSVLGVGVFGPGLPSWPAARAVLCGEAAYAHGEPLVPPATLLPPAERRRATAATRLALTAAQEALASSGLDPATVPVVFASSSGTDIIHDICTMLAAGDYQISPIKFHNSVHNAVSGYYSIAAGSHRGATSLCAYDGSAAAGLLEAVVQASDGGEPVLLVSYDTPYPFPLSVARPIEGAWAIALALGRGAPASTGARLSLTVTDDTAESTLGEPALEAVRTRNPTARLLPLIAAIARRDAGAHRIVMRQQNGGVLRIEVT